MKRGISIFVLFLIWLVAFAQNKRGIVKSKDQHGIVKLKSHWDSNGGIIPGKGLPNATITIKGGNAAISNKRGKFALAISGSNYYLKDVRKTGYRLTDPETLEKQHFYSKDPLVLLMESLDNGKNDKWKTHKLRKTIEKDNKQKQEKIKKETEQGKLTAEESNKLLQELADKQENDERTVREIVDYYSKIDLDKENDFNLHIIQLILEGMLSEADSLINTKGDINTRIAKLHQLQEHIAKAETKKKNLIKELIKLKEPLKKKEKIILDDIANDCYSKFVIFKILHQLDSAAYYIERRAELDTLDIYAQNEAADFISTYLPQKENAIEIYRRMLAVSEEKYGKISMESAYCNTNLGTFFRNLGHYEHALKHFTNALNIYEQLGNKYPRAETLCKTNMGSLYIDNQEYSKALKVFSDEIDIIKKLFGEQSEELANTYNSMGNCYKGQQKYLLAEEFYNKAKNIWIKLLGEDSYEVSVTNNGIAGILKNTGRHQDARKLYDDVLAFRIKEYGETHPSVATVYKNLSSLFIEMGELDSAYMCQTQAIEIVKNVYGEKSPITADYYGNISEILQQKNDWRGSLDALKKAYDIVIDTESATKRDIIINIDYTMAQILQESDDAEFRKEYDRFICDKVYVALIPQEESSPAAQLGMSGEYYILEYEDWNIDCNSSMLLASERLSGKPKTVVFMKDDSIQSHHFENRIGANFFLKVVGEEKKKDLIERFINWKK